MLAKVRLHNYRCFEDHVVPLRARTAIVGRNNAGKSTVIEALRLVSIVASRYANLDFREGPWWLDGPDRFRGVAPSLQGIDFNFDTVCYLNNYDDLPSVIATFDSGQEICIYLSSEQRAIHAVLRDSQGRVVLNHGHALSTPLPGVGTLPPVGPLAKEEQILTRNYVRSQISTVLSPSHFRNQLNLYYEAFGDFRDLVERSWPGFGISGLEGQGGFVHTPLRLNVRQGAFPSEVGCLGHGLQVWLQIMWFLARSPALPTVILDEPDVYLHADMQRRLIRLLRQRHQQVIVATHSTEIVSEMRPNEIVYIERNRRSSRFLSSSPAVQKIIRYIGGVPSPELVKLYNSPRCLFVEGNDVTFLKAFQDRLFPNSQHPIDAVSKTAIGGWSGWNSVKMHPLLTKNLTGEKLMTYCILDSDYHSPEEVHKRLEEAKHCQIQLHVWERKEIENYVLVPAAIARLIAAHKRPDVAAPTADEVQEKMDAICDNLRDAVTDLVAQSLYEDQRRRGAGPVSCNPLARAKVEAAYETFAGKVAVVPGKQLIKLLSEWSRRTYGTALDPIQVARELHEDEVPLEVRHVMSALETMEEV